MKTPYYDKDQNAVFFDGALNKINPDTETEWASEAEALAFIDALPVAEAFVIPKVVITSVTGTDVTFADNVIEADADIVMEATIEIQKDGVTLAGFTKTTRVSIDRDGQAGFKVVKVDFVDGVGTLKTSLPTGEFYITEDSVNRRLLPEEAISMVTPLSIVVSEAPVA